MKKHLNKIILNLSLIILISACHTLEHNGFRLKPTSKNILNEEVEEKKINVNNVRLLSEKAIPSKKIREKPTEKLRKSSKLQPIKKIKETKPNKFNLISILKLSESKLFQNWVKVTLLNLKVN